MTRSSDCTYPHNISFGNTVHSAQTSQVVFTRLTRYLGVTVKIENTVSTGRRHCSHLTGATLGERVAIESHRERSGGVHAGCNGAMVVDGEVL
jgi:hypothetical protein